MPCSPWSMTRPQAGHQHPAVTFLTPEYLRHLLKARTGRMGNRAEYCKPRPEAAMPSVISGLPPSAAPAAPPPALGQRLGGVGSV
jgi:hypothetical protein